MDECLIDRPYCINDEWAIVGNTAWYDYSYGDSKFSEERLAQRKYYGATWQDKEKIDWPLNDQSMSELALKQTEKDVTICVINIIFLPFTLARSFSVCFSANSDIDWSFNGQSIFSLSCHVAP